MIHTLSIAGFDPSSAAGVTADIRTFEACGTNGLGVCTAVTVQNDLEFRQIRWMDIELIKEQISVLFDRYEIDFVKIGIVEDLESLSVMIHHLKQLNKSVSIIWDPVLKSSSGFSFHSEWNTKKVSNICKKVFLVTPNLEEWKKGFGNEPFENAFFLYGNVLVKSSSETVTEISDSLITENKIKEITGVKTGRSKHGTGCLMSSAITANLALGNDLLTSCKNAKNFIEHYLMSPPLKVENV